MYTVYTGDRVRLRPFASAEELIGCAMENHYASFVHWGPHQRTAAEERKYFEEDGGMALPGDGTFAIELRAGDLAGISYYTIPKRGITGMVGTFVREQHRHQRIGVEARRLCMCFIFDNTPVERIEAITLSNNIAALKSLERCGMTLEGEQSARRFSQGCWRSYVYYTIFRDQWERMDYRHGVRRGAQ